MNQEHDVLAAFTRGRRHEAVQVTALAALCLSLGVVLTGDTARSLPLAGGATLLAFLLVRFSALPARRALAFVFLGLVPMFAALLSQSIGHACTPAGCVSLCAPFCATGGGIAGALLSRVAAASRRPVRAWLSGVLVVGVTGSVGCACVGASGIIGLLGGLLVVGAATGVRLRFKASKA